MCRRWRNQKTSLLLLQLKSLSCHCITSFGGHFMTRNSYTDIETALYFMIKKKGRKTNKCSKSILEKTQKTIIKKKDSLDSFENFVAAKLGLLFGDQMGYKHNLIMKLAEYLISLQSSKI